MWERGNWERANWERANWERANWERANWERANWERANWERANGRSIPSPVRRLAQALRRHRALYGGRLLHVTLAAVSA